MCVSKHFINSCAYLKFCTINYVLKNRVYNFLSYSLIIETIILPSTVINYCMSNI